MNEHNTICFTLVGVAFEYDEEKEQINIRKHGISFRTAARVFFDDDYIEGFDHSHSDDEKRYNVIGDISAGNAKLRAAIGNIDHFYGKADDILYVVYTERIKKAEDDKYNEVIRLISARLANNFERGLYYGQYI
ncbi:MAG: BrnT family toxin [Oscillospiraceae bacterium]|nr:BrnT family toxin [Oscillospiraceae bacterium]